MSWKIRIFFVASGALLLFAGYAQASAGKYVFDNASYHQTTFAWGSYGVGAFLILLAFLPPSDWVYRHITTRKAKHKSSRKK